MRITIRIIGKNFDSIKEFYKMLKRTSETKKYLCTDKISWDYCEPIKGVTVHNKSDGLYEHFISGHSSNNYVLGDMFLSTCVPSSTLIIKREDEHDMNIVSFEEASMALGLEIQARNTWFDDEAVRYVIEDLLVKNGRVSHYDEQELYVLEKTPLGNISEMSATDYLFFE